MIYSSAMPATPPMTPPDRWIEPQDQQDLNSAPLSVYPDALGISTPASIPAHPALSYPVSSTTVWYPNPSVIGAMSLENSATGYQAINYSIEPQSMGNMFHGYEMSAVPIDTWHAPRFDHNFLAGASNIETPSHVCTTMSSSMLPVADVDIHDLSLRPSQSEVSDAGTYATCAPVLPLAEQQVLLDSTLAPPIDVEQSHVPRKSHWDANDTRKWKPVPRRRQQRRPRILIAGKWRCDDCGMFFERSYNLTKHKLIHNERERPYRCLVEGCLQAPFVREADLIRHQETVSIAGTAQECV